MPNKLSTAIVGSLAVGLTMPLNTVAAQAMPAAPSTPTTGDGSQRSAGDAATAAPGVLDGVALRTSNEAGQFHRPLDADSYRYTSEYGARCIPVQGGSTYHLGQDMGAAEGSQIRAVADGTVVRASSGTRYTSGYVVLRHQVDGETVHSAYYHMWDATTHVQVGQQVSGGQTIALVGNSGPSTAPHLHVEIWEGAWLTGESQDPTRWLAERGVSLKGDAADVQNIATPSSCGYFTAQDTALRSGASSTAPVIEQLPAGTEMTSVPGDMVNGMVRVTVDGQSGWVRHPHITPNRPAGGDSTESAAASPGGSTDSSSSGHHLGQYLPGTRGLVEQLASLLGQAPETTFERLAARDEYTDENGILDHMAILDRVEQLSGGSSESSGASESSGSSEQSSSGESSGSSESSSAASGHHLGQYLPGTRGLVEELASLLGQSPEQTFENLVSQEKFTDANGILDHMAILDRVEQLSGGSSESSGASESSGSSEQSSSGESSGSSESSSAASGHHLGQYLPGTRGLVEELASLLGQSPEQTFENLVSQEKFTDANGILDHGAIQSRVDELSGSEPQAQSAPAPSSDSSGESASSTPSHHLGQYTAATQGVVKELASLLGQSPEQTFENLVSQEKFTDANGILDHGAIQSRVDELSGSEPQAQSAPATSDSSADTSSGSSDGGSSHSLSQYKAGTRGLVEQLASILGQSPEQTFENLITDDRFTDAGGILDHGAIQARVDEMTAPEPAPEPQPADTSSSSSSGSSDGGSSHSLSQYTDNTQGVVKELASLLGQSAEQTFENLITDDRYTDSNGILDHAAIQSRVDEMTAPETEPEPAPEPEPEDTGSAAQTGESSTPPPSYNPIWDRLAMCESSGDWSIDTGNGFYGGIQFTKQSWEAVGGTGYPNQASKYEQIARGYELWKLQGWGAWPGCQEKLGLAGDPGGVENYTLPGSGSGSGTMEAATTWQLSLSVPLRAEADSSSEKVVQLPRGAAVRQLDAQGSWVQVRYEDDGETVVGWVNTSVMS